MTRLKRQYRRIARSLSNAELMRSSMDETLSADDLVRPQSDSTRRFLDFYGDEGLRIAFERYGLIEALARRGYTEVQIETHASSERHTLFIHAEVRGQSERLVELVARRDKLVPGDDLPGLDGDRPLDVLTIEWLTLRHPLGQHSERRPCMPGQDTPGLRLGERVMEMLYRATERLHLDGLLAVPSHFHLAVLYNRELPFLDPWYAAQLLVLEACLLVREGLTLAQASWAVEWGCVRYGAEDEPFVWRPQVLLWPRSDELKRYFESRAYHAEVSRAAAMQRYRLDVEAFWQRWERECDDLYGTSHGEG